MGEFKIFTSLYVKDINSFWNRPEENSTGGEAEIRVKLTDKEKKLILEHTFAENSLTDRLKTAESKDGIIIVKYSPDDLEGLIGYIAAEANHAENKALQKKLDALYEKMDDLLSENE